MTYFLFLALLHVASSKPVSNGLYVLGMNGEEYNIAGYSSFNIYNEKVQLLLAGHIKDTFNFVLKYNRTYPAVLLSQTTPEKIVFLQILYSFDQKNSSLYSFLSIIAENFMIKDRREFKSWMDASFDFPPKKILNMINYIAKENIYLANDLMEQMLYLSEKYKVFENAVSIGDCTVVKWLLQKGLTSSVIGGYILQSAWQNSQIDIVTEIMKHSKVINLNIAKEIVNEIFNNNETLLHVAVRLGLKEMVDFLVRNLGANINSKDIFGRSPLYRAVELNNSEIVELLITLGGDPYKEGLLEQAIIRGHLETVKVLVKLNALNDFKNNRKLLFLAVETNNIGILVLLALTSYGKQNLNSTDDFGDTLIHIASSKGFVESITALRQLDVAYDSKNNYGQTPLYKAVENGSLKVIRELIAAGADINTRTHLGDTLMHLTATKGNINVAKLLIQNHINIEQKNSMGHVPLYKAAQSGKIEMMNLLISHGADIHVTNNGLTLLHEAAKEGNENAVMMLIDSGFNDIDVAGVCGVTPLHIAAGHGHFRVVEILLDKGANPNAISKDHWSPMHRAVIAGCHKIVRLLLAYGANPDLENMDGETALQLAIAFGKSRVINLLKRYNDNKKVRLVVK